MHLFRCAILYAALLCSANAATADIAALEALRDGDMKKLNFAEAPKLVPEAVLLDADDAEHSLAEYRGKWVVLNFWATWCAPCRLEMPSLERLQTAMGGETLAVVPVAAGRNPVEAINRFYADAGIVSLPVLRDPTQQFTRGMGIVGLPMTVILNPDGAEVARLIGDAEWDSASAMAILAALIAGE